MTVKEIMAQLRGFGDEKIKTILLRHGVREAFFGVKIEHLKTIRKKVRTDDKLARELYATGNADAMYLARLIAADGKMTKKDWYGRRGHERYVCKVPDPAEYIKKVEARGSLGKKKKTVKC